VNYLSVCAGIEAASVAWHPLGWNPIAFSEIEKFPAQLLAHHYPQTPNWGDMTKFKEWPDADVNVLVGGTPCQSFSVAGLRKGLDDPRGNLMLTYLAIADRYRPEWVVWENVPGVLSSNGGRDFASFLRGLAELGYGFAYRILDAQYFGVAQRRRRVFVVGHIRDWQRAAAVLFERHSLQRHPAPRRKAGQKATASLRACPPASGGQGTDAEHTVMMLKDVAPCLDAMMDKKWGSNQWVDSGQFVFCASDGQKNASIQDNLAPTLTKQDEQPYIVGTIGARTGLSIGAQDAANGHMIPTIGGGFDVAHSLRGDGFDASEDGTGRGTPLVPIQNALRGKSQNGLGIGEGGEPMYTLDKASQHAVAFVHQARGTQTTLGYDPDSRTSPTLAKCQTPAIAFDLAQITSNTNRTRVQEGLPASTLNAAGQMHTASSMQVRRLTPRECERLQGFPDDYTLVQHRNKPAADGPRYKALGNSMAVPVMRWIGERIKQVEGL